MIKTTVKTEKLFAHKTPCLVLFCPEGKKMAADLKNIDEALSGPVASAFKGKRFEGKSNQTLLLNAKGAMKAEHVLLVGIGKPKEVTQDNLRQAAGTAAALFGQSVHHFDAKRLRNRLHEDGVALDLESGYLDKMDLQPIT